MIMRIRRLAFSSIVTTIAAILSAYAAPAKAQTVSIETVVLSGDTAPRTTEGLRTFRSFGRPVLNASGEVAFHAFLDFSNFSNDSGIWAGGPGSLNLVAREGDEAPGTGSRTFRLFFRPPNLNASGEVAFRAFLDASNVSNDLGIWAGGPGSLKLVAREGDEAPGTGADNYLIPLPPVLNPSGQLAFAALLGTGRAGIWEGSAGDLALVALTGDLAPGAEPLTFRTISIPVLNPPGQVVFSGRLSFATFESGIWAGTAGSLTPFARDGDLAPGTGGLTFAGFFGTPVLNASGQLAFRTFLDTGAFSLDDFGIWAGSAGNLALVVRKGDPAPGAVGASFSQFSEPVLNASGQVAFEGSLDTGDTSNDSGIWAGGPGNLGLVAREGDEAPGAEPLTFPSLLTTPLSSPDLNASGQVAFIADLDPAPLSFDQGIWVGGPGHLALVVRTGDTLEGRIVRGLLLSKVPPSGNEDGRLSALNDACQLAFQAGFTDNSEGIFVASVDFSPVAVDLVNDLILAVTDLDLDKGTENPLLDKLNVARQMLEDGNKAKDNTVRSVLGDFINLVEKKRNQIGDEVADSLIASADQIIALLACT